MPLLGAPPTAHPTTDHRTAVLAIMCAGMFLVLLDVTAVNVALPDIGSALGGGVAALQWVIDGYAVTIAGLLLAAGVIGDRVGHRTVVTTGFVIFGTASFGCALAPGVAVLITCRVVQGAGAALLLPGTMALIAHAYPRHREQARAIGTWAAVSSLALPAGPVVGGVLVSASSWRLVFWINVPVVSAVVAATRALVTHHPGRRTGRFDVAGTASVATMLAAGVFTIVELGHGAGLAAVAVAGAVAVIAGALAVRTESRVPRPVVPLDLLRRGRFLAPNMIAFVMNLVFNGTLFVTTLYLQDIREFSPLQAGLCVLPMAVPLVVLAPVSGRLTARYGPRPSAAAGCALGLLGGLLLALVTRDGPIGWLLVSIGVTGLGGGLITASVVSAAIRAVSSDRAGLATGVSNAARQTGTAAGVAVFGAVAGSPTAAEKFVASLHVLAAVSTALWLVGIVLAVSAFARRHRSLGSTTCPIPPPIALPRAPSRSNPACTSSATSVAGSSTSARRRACGSG